LSSQTFKCATGNCDNGKGTVLVEFKYKKKVWGDWQKAAEYYVIEGNFINGRINGFGKIMRYFNEEAFKKYQPLPFDSLRMTNEVLASMETDMYEASSGYYVQGFMRKGIYIDAYDKIWDAFYYQSTAIFGTLTIPKSDVVYRGFLCAAALLPNQGWIGNYCPGLGLLLEIRKNGTKLVPFGNKLEANDPTVLPFAETEYSPERKAVQQLKYDKGVYNGEALNGVPEGFGEWISDDLLWIKFGYFKKGKLHGLAALNFDLNNGKSQYITYGYALAQFRNGIATKAHTYRLSGYYYGEINSAFVANGYGIKTDPIAQLKTQEGYFENGELNGVGKLSYFDGKIVNGNFVNGKMVSGNVVYTVNSLRMGDVVKINGKKYAVVEDPWEPNSFQYLRGFVKLHDGTVLKEGMNFEKLNEKPDQFYTQCKMCSGTGVIQQYTNANVITSMSPLMRRTVNTPQGYKEESYYNFTYGTELRHTGKVACSSCNGAGRFVKGKEQ
jgi:hypothetical protein